MNCDLLTIIKFTVFFSLFTQAHVVSANPQKIALGKLIFTDTTLSEPAGQSCHSCHDSQKSHADRDKVISPGANATKFGNRNAPSISYIKFNPPLYRDKEEDHWVGGFFLDGRAKTLEEQVKGPFLNPVEIANPSI